MTKEAVNYLIKQIRQIPDSPTKYALLKQIKLHTPIEQVIKALNGLDKDDLFAFFRSQSLPTRYEGLLNFFKADIPEAAALDLLYLADKLTDEQLVHLFIDPSANHYLDKDSDCFLLYFDRFTPSVIFKGLDLLSRLTDTELAKVLSIKKTQPQVSTVLDIPFNTKVGGNEIAIAFISLLNRGDELRPLLYDSTKKDKDSFLHRLVRHQYNKALRYYLEQPHLESKQSAYKLAYELNHKAMISLFQAQPIVQALNHPKAHIKKPLEQLLKKHPNVLETRWNNNLSLAHMAILKNKPHTLSLLLNYGADPNAQDAQGYSLLDYAFRQANSESIKILVQNPGIQLTKANVKGLFPLYLIMLTKDFYLIAAAVQSLNKASNSDKLASFIQAFTAVDRLKQGLEAFDKHLSLNDYCMSYQDSKSLFLMHAAPCFGLDSNEWKSHAAAFVSNHLNCLANKEAKPVDKELATKQLLVFLFGFKATVLEQFLQALPLNPEQRIALDLILCQGLVQPLFFTGLSFDEQLNIERCLYKPRQSLASIASVHFRHSDLTRLPVATLLHYADILNEESLYQLSSSRFNAPLIVLSLEKELKTSPRSESKIQLLLAKLERKLNLFNDNISKELLNELGLMLNLTFSEEIKQVIKAFMHQAGSSRSYLSRHCEQLFNEFKSNQSLIEGSLLRDLFLCFCNNPNFVQKTQNHLAFGEFIRCAKANEIIEMINKHLKRQIANLDIRHAFHEVIIQGILANPELPMLLRPLFKWAISQGMADALIACIADLLKTPIEWEPLDALLNENLSQYRQLLLPLMDLRLLCTERFIEINAFKNLIESWTDGQLIQLADICKKAHALELGKALETVLQARENQIPWRFVIKDELVYDLRQSMDAIALHQSQLVSLAALKAGLYLKGSDVNARLVQFSLLLQRESNPLRPEAIDCWISSYRPLLTAGTSCESQAFINALALLMSQSSPSLQLEIIQRMPEDLLEILIAQSVSGIHSEDASRGQACTALLTYFAHCNFCDNARNIEIIKNNLGQSDTSILKEENLVRLADSILNTKDKNLEESTLNGIWIARLLTQPQFIALCNPAQMFQLIERLRIILLTLKQDEYESICRFLNKEISFKEKGEDMDAWRRKLLKDPKRLAFFLQKQQQLLQFRADHSIRELQLQSRAAIQAAEPELAKEAGKNWDAYYNQQLSKGSSQFLFQKMSNFLYSWMTQGLGDIPLSQKKLYQWINQYLPHQNFEQRELAQKNKNSLYNETGQIIGYINEIQCAVTADNQLLIQTQGMQAGMEVYDERAQVIGVLKENGVVERNNIFQKNTSALLIGTVPMEQLLQSAPTLALLLHDVLIEQSIDVLYDCEELEADQNKRAWVETQLNQQLAASKQVIPKESIQSMLNQHQDDMVKLLSQIQLPQNAQTLFIEILAHDSKRQALFKNPAPEFLVFLKRIGLEETLANFLQEDHDKSWYADGLAWFAKLLKGLAKANVLTKALLILDSRQSNNLLSKEENEAIMHSFLSTEAISKIVLQGLLADPSLSIQESQSDAIRDFCSLFNKSQLIPCIQDLNTNSSSWRYSHRYRLLLMIFASQQRALFAEEELRYSPEAWSGQELRILSVFVSIHLQNKQNPDKNFEIGGNLLSELVFRAANFGQIDFFYNNNTFNPQIAGYRVKKKPSNQLALPEPLKNMISPLAALQACFDNKEVKIKELKQYLRENNGLIDWKKMAADSWALAQGNDLSLFSAFLKNYVGPTKSLAQMIEHFLSSPELLTDRKHLHSVTGLLAQIPNQEVCALIFSSLASHPKLIDAKVLQHMAYYYQKTQMKAAHIHDPIRMAFDLIRYFGQQKEYKLTLQCCSVLKAQVPKGKLQKHIQKIGQEALIENQLRDYSNKWYFKLLVFLKRLWHYNKEPSSFVCFCDKEVPISKLSVPEEIGNREFGGKHVEQQKKIHLFAKKYKQMDLGKKAQPMVSSPKAGLFKPAFGTKIPQVPSPVEEVKHEGLQLRSS